MRAMSYRHPSGFHARLALSGRGVLFGLVAAAAAAGFPARPADASSDESVESAASSPQQVVLLPGQPLLPSMVEPQRPPTPVEPALTRRSQAITRPGDEASDFTVGPGDVLQVTVWDYPELSAQIVVLPDNTVSYPLLGVVQAGGLTIQRVADAIKTGLQPYLAQSAQVSIVMAHMQSRQFSVLGEVKTPGSYPLWTDRVTLLEAIAQAGGLGPVALPAEVAVFRPDTDGIWQTLSVNLTAFLDRGSGAPLLTLQPGDVVYVPSQTTRRKVAVLGQVRVPGLYTLTPNMTVVEALTAAGWVQPSGVLTSVMLIRDDANGSREFFRVNAQRAIRQPSRRDALAEALELAQDPQPQPGDIIYVPEHFIAKVGDFVSFFSSKIEPAAAAYLGVYDATNPASVLVNR